MRIAICDDDLAFLEQLKSYLEDFFKRSHLKCPQIVTFSTGEALLDDSSKKDIVFLDIEMPGLNGITVANKLKGRNKNVILFITTAYVEYLDEAMRVHVFRYLSKPLEKLRLFRNLKDALQVYSLLTVRIPIETREGVFTVDTAAISCIEASGRKIFVHTRKKSYESIQNMAYWIQTLPENCFLQSHRSFIVNFAHITEFNHTLILLDNGQFKAYLTRRKYTTFKSAYLTYLESMR